MIHTLWSISDNPLPIQFDTPPRKQNIVQPHIIPSSTPNALALVARNLPLVHGEQLHRTHSFEIPDAEAEAAEDSPVHALEWRAGGVSAVGGEHAIRFCRTFCGGGVLIPGVRDCVGGRV